MNETTLLSSQLDLISTLNQLGLYGMAENFRIQASNPNIYQGLSFEERLSDLTGAQQDHLRKKTLERILKNARLKSHMTLNEIAKAPSEGLTPQLLKEFSGIRWVENGINVAITGSCGVGKTALACAIALNLAQQEIPVLYCRTFELLMEIEAKKDDFGARKRLMQKLSRFKVIILDDFGCNQKFNDEQKNILWELADDRYGEKPIVMCAQIRKKGFYDLFPANDTGTESLVDRLSNPCIEIPLSGRSRRANVSESIKMN